MARLKNVKTGVIVNVDDEKVARLGSEWKPVKVEPTEPALRRSKK